MLFYIHVPFCRARCAYCSFFSIAVGRRNPPADYVPALVRDIAWLGSKFGAKAQDTNARDTVTSIFFGGGTPSLLSPEDITNILGAIGQHFSLAPDAEISMEANPESLQEKSRVQAFREAGVTRISMGVQSMSDNDLRTLGRIHTVEQAQKAAEHVHAAGFASFGIDLMWGLPGQSLEDWLDVLQRACELSPDHISAYGLTIEEGTRLARSIEQGKLFLPEENTLAQMFLQGHEMLEARGFEHYEISNFARKGHACRHNLGYWQRTDYLGVGAGAVSTWRGQRVSEPCDLKYWLASEPHERNRDIEQLDRQTVREEHIMLSMRTKRGLDVTSLDRDGGDFLGENKSYILALVDAGLACIRHEGSKTFLALTPRGMLASNDIVARFF